MQLVLQQGERLSDAWTRWVVMVHGVHPTVWVDALPLSTTPSHRHSSPTAFVIPAQQGLWSR